MKRKYFKGIKKDAVVGNDNRNKQCVFSQYYNIQQNVCENKTIKVKDLLTRSNRLTYSLIIPEFGNSGQPEETNLLSGGTALFLARC